MNRYVVHVLAFTAAAYRRPAYDTEFTISQHHRSLQVLCGT